MTWPGAPSRSRLNSQGTSVAARTHPQTAEPPPSKVAQQPPSGHTVTHASVEASARRRYSVEPPPSKVAHNKKLAGEAMSGHYKFDSTSVLLSTLTLTNLPTARPQRVRRRPRRLSPWAEPVVVTVTSCRRRPPTRHCPPSQGRAAAPWRPLAPRPAPRPAPRRRRQTPTTTRPARPSQAAPSP